MIQRKPVRAGVPRPRSCDVLSIAICCTAGLFAVPARPAAAQAADQSTAPGLQEIIVTAQRRGQNIQEVPLSVTAFRGETLAQAGIQKALDLQQIDSSLFISQQSGVVVPFLRGIGNPGSATAANESSVPIYIDDVYYTRLSPAYLALANIDRVEVLKGPQGTLFGRNSTGGLIQIFTRDPGQETVVDATVGYGSYDTLTTKLYAATPITDAVRVGVSFVESHQGEGWGRNYFDGDSTYTAKYYNLNAKLIADITDSTRVRLTLFDVYEDSSQGTVQGALYRGSLRGVPPAYDTLFSPPGGFYDLYTNTENFNKHRGWGGSIKIDQDLDFADFTSISSYRSGKEDFNSEGDQTQINWLNYVLNIRQQEITQEFQLKSKKDSPISWIVGAYYMNSRDGYAPTTIKGDAISLGGLSELDYYGLQRINSYAGFAQTTIPVPALDRTNLTMGIRYTVDNVKGAGSQEAVIPGLGTIAVAPNYNQSVNFEKMTYKVAADHKFTDDIMMYASISRGYKSGTFNTLPLAAPPTRPEVVDAYELGVKSEFLEHRLRLDLSAFLNQIKDPQVQLIKNVGGVASVQFANAGRAETEGFELDGTAQVTEALTVRLGAQYLYAHYIDFKNAPVNIPLLTPPYGVVTVAGDATGKQMPQAPKYKLNIGADYDLTTALGDLIFDANMAYRSSFKWEPDNVLTEPGLVLFNASLTFKPEFDDRLSVRLWGDNLSGEKYYVNELTQTGPVGYMGAVAEPRTYGIELRYIY